MRPRVPWANTILLLLLLLQLVTGYLGFLNAAERKAWILWLHGAGAYAIVLLVYWKGSIIWTSLQRRKRWTRARVLFLFLIMLLFGTLLLGMIWSFVGPSYLWGFSLLTLHIFLAVPLILLLAFHAWRMRWIWRLPASRDRRLFLRTGGFLLAGWVSWFGMEALLRRLSLSGSTRRFTGSYEIGSFTGRFPVTSWINDRPAPIATEQWRLVIDGAVETPLEISYSTLREFAHVDQTHALDCTGGFYTTQIWRGVPLTRLLADAGLAGNAQSVTVSSVTGYYRRFTLEEIQTCLLASDVAGKPLSHGHGFPARLVVPTERGFAWVKWVTHITVNTTAAIWQPPLPLQ